MLKSIKIHLAKGKGHHMKPQKIIIIGSGGSGYGDFQKKYDHK